MPEWKAQGKLLLSSEYMVLQGAEALALPVQPGQILRVGPLPDSLYGQQEFHWIALECGRPWFNARFNRQLEILESSQQSMALRLREILLGLLDMQAGFKEQLTGSLVETRLEFPPDYGLGSSSTLTDLLARWSGVDPMDLHFKTSKGSGYDVACARAGGPILYSLENNSATVRPVAFRPPFSEGLWFAWLGKKQNSAHEVEAFHRQLRPDNQDVQYFSRLSRAMLEARSLDAFMEVMEEHEDRLSSLLGRPVIRTEYPDLEGSIKSLGAWGGDFVLIATEWEEARLRSYLKAKGIDVVYAYKELIYDRSR